MSTAPIYYFADDHTGADVNVIAGLDTNDGLTEATAFKTYDKMLSMLNDETAVPAGTRFRHVRGGASYQSAPSGNISNQASTVTITGITRSGTTATATTNLAHNLEVDDVFSKAITGCDQSEYNIAATVTAVTEFTFSFEVTGTPATPATTSDKIRFYESMIFIESYVPTTFTPAVDAKPLIDYDDSGTLRQHPFGASGSTEGYSFSGMNYLYSGLQSGNSTFMWLFSGDKDSIFVDDCIIDGHRTAMNPAGLNQTNINLTNSTIKNCWGNGLLFNAAGGLIDNNTFTNNGHNGAAGGTVQLHNIYVNQGDDITISNNTCYQSALDLTGKAVGVSIVVHKDSNNIIIEDNYVYEDIGFCNTTAWGITVDGGNAAPETFTDIIIRRNIVENVGNVGIAVNSLAGTNYIENNIFIQNQTHNDLGRIVVGVKRDADDAVTSNCTVRNNSMYGSGINSGIKASEGTGISIISNSMYSTNTGTVSFLDLPLSITDNVNYDNIDNNLAYAPNATTFHYELNTTGNLAAWTTASIFSDNDQVADPLYTSATDLTPQSGSPLINAGHSTLSSATDYATITRDSTPDIGAYEFSVASMNTKVVTGLTPTSTGTVTYDSAGFGTPQAALIHITSATSASNPNVDASICIGMTDGTSEFSVGSASDDGGATSATYRNSATTLVSLIDGVGAAVVTGAFSAWSTDGLTINYTAVAASQHHITVTLFKGLDNVKAFSHQITTTGVNDITTIGFKPNLVLTYGVGASGLGAAAHGLFSIGAAHNSSTDVVTQGMINFSSLNAQASDSSYSGARNDSCIGRMHNGSQSWEGAAQDFDSSGFSINTGVDNPSNHYMFGLAMTTSDVDGADVSIIDSPTTTGTFSVTDPAFEPEYVMIAASTTATINSEINTDPMAIGVGMFDGVSEYSMGFDIDDGAATMDNQSNYSTNAVQTYEFGGTTHDLMHEGTFNSFTATGYDLDFPTYVDGTARKWLSISIKGADLAVSSGDGNKGFLISLGRMGLR